MFIVFLFSFMYNYVPISFSLLLVSSSDLQSPIISNTTEVEKAHCYRCLYIFDTSMSFYNVVALYKHWFPPVTIYRRVARNELSPITSIVLETTTVALHYLLLKIN